MVPPSCSFLRSPLSLHKPGLNNKGMNPVEVSANGNKTHSCNLAWGCDVVSIQPYAHVWSWRGGRQLSSGDQGRGCRVVSGSLCFLTGWGYMGWPSLGVVVNLGTVTLTSSRALWAFVKFFWSLIPCAGVVHIWAPSPMPQHATSRMEVLELQAWAGALWQHSRGIHEKLQGWACGNLGWVCIMVWGTCWEMPPAQLS